MCKDSDTSGTRTLIAEINAGGWTGKNTVPVVIDEEEEDRKEKEYVREATEEACLVSASVLRRRFNKYVTRSSSDICVSKGGEYRNGSTASAPVSCKAKGLGGGSGGGGGGGKVMGNDDLDASYILEERIQREAALSARGVWLYTVGLVGKPSAGIYFLMRLWLRLRSSSIQNYSPCSKLLKCYCLDTVGVSLRCSQCPVCKLSMLFHFIVFLKCCVISSTIIRGRIGTHMHQTRTHTHMHKHMHTNRHTHRQRELHHSDK